MNNFIFKYRRNSNRTILAIPISETISSHIFMIDNKGMELLKTSHPQRLIDYRDGSRCVKIIGVDDV